MSGLDDLIKYENENTGLDFKAVQYPQAKFEALIKDIMAMANAHIIGERFIVVGVKHHPDGTRDFLSIDEKEFMDSATYQQLIRDNIEPEIHFDYFPYRIDGALLGVFRLFNCEDRPYMMRKQYSQSLRQGDAFIRKGSHQSRLLRQDMNRIIESKQRSGFEGVIRIGFAAPGEPSELICPALGDFTLPSDRATQTIQEILKQRQRDAANPTRTFMQGLIDSGAMNSLAPLGRPLPYAQRRTEELQKNLQNVKVAYRDHDLYALCEEQSQKINIRLFNQGDSYVEDSSITVEISKLEGLIVPDEIHSPPPEPDVLYRSLLSSHRFFSGRNYPRVTVREQKIIVRDKVGNLRHGIPTDAFNEPLRMVLGRELIGKTLKLQCALFGKQLREPYTATLLIHVTAPQAGSGE